MTDTREESTNRIETLELEVEVWKSRALHQNEVVNKLEVKLEKAMMALEGYDDPSSQGDVARKALAELKGEKLWTELAGVKPL
jgi:hypothetical protein